MIATHLRYANGHNTTLANYVAGHLSKLMFRVWRTALEPETPPHVGMMLFQSVMSVGRVRVCSPGFDGDTTRLDTLHTMPDQDIYRTYVDRPRGRERQATQLDMND